MGSHVPRDIHQGLVLPDPRFKTENISDALSSFTQKGPSPGQPVPKAGSAGYLQLEALGTISTPQNAEIRCQKEGAAVGGERGGRYAKRAAGDADWDGYLNHNKVCGFETVTYTTGNGRRSPDTLRLASEQLLSISANYDDALNTKVSAKTRNAQTGAWSSEVSVVENLEGSPVLPTVIQLPSGRVYCYYLDKITELGVQYWVLSYSYSDDDGATWAVAGERLAGLRQSSGTWTPNKMRAVYHNGFVTLAISHDSTKTLHLLSADLGSSFEEIEDLSSVHQGDLVVDAAGRVLMSYVNPAGEVLLTRKGTPGSKFADSPVHGTSMGIIVDVSVVQSPLCVVIDSTGYLWIIGRAASAGVITRGMIWAYRFDMLALDNENDRWNSDGLDGVAHPIDTGDNDFYLKEFDADVHDGSIFLITNWVAPGSGAGNSLHAIRLGGWSSIDWRRQTFGYKSGAPSYNSGLIWFGIADPSAVTGLTETTGGGSTVTVGAEGATIASTAGLRNYLRTGSSSVPALHMFCVHLETGGDTSSAKVGAESFWGNATNSTGLEIRLGSAGFEVFDIRGAAVINTLAGPATAPADLTVPTVFLVYHFDQQYLVAHRPVNSSKWTTSHKGTALTSAATVSATKFTWGHLQTSSDRSVWRWVGSAMFGMDFDPRLATATFPQDLQGREFSLYRQWVHEGLMVRARGSSAHVGDEWDIPTHYEGGIGNMDPQRSPDGESYWASVDDSTEEFIAWELEAGLPTRLLSPTMGIFLHTNFRTATVEGYDGSSWTVLGTIDASTGFTPSAGNSKWDMAGNHLVPHADAVDGEQFASMDEGLMAHLTYISGPGTVALHAKASKAGVWSNGPAGMRLLLDENHLGTLAATKGAGSTAKIVAKKHLTLLHNLVDEYQAIGLRIPAQATPEGYFKIHRVFPGPYSPVGLAWDWRRRHRVVSNREVFQTRSGARRRVKRGENRRTVEVAWPDGWDISQIQGASPSPDYLSPHSSSAEAFAHERDGTFLDQVLERTEGGRLPVVYVASSAPAGSSALEVVTMTSMHQCLFGQIGDAISRQVILGDAVSNEVVTIDALVIQEDV